MKNSLKKKIKNTIYNKFKKKNLDQSIKKNYNSPRSTKNSKKKIYIYIYNIYIKK